MEARTRPLIVSYAPHIHTGSSIEKVMYTVVIALVPSIISSVYYFGLRALSVVLVSVLSCVASEFLVNKLRKKKLTCFDGSAVVTGILLALIVPSGVPLGMVVLGAVVAIIITKELFGGIGYNIFNPALVGRVFLLISFPVAMTALPVPHAVDMITAASPLGILKTEGARAITDITFWKLFFGEIGGSMGETSALAILIGAALLYMRGYIFLKVPLIFIGTTFAFTGIFYLIDPAQYASPVFHLLSGGLMLGAFFMATDMVTSPMMVRGQIIFGFSCGLLTGVIRLFGGYPEGVAFAILIMNAFVPLLDRWDLYSRTKQREGHK
ncbi:MAG: RnfABCDGE type electron transport complex subunit D [Thermodesulfobacteriota bacterium]|nr:RnfABCDGE type electron transport complex subunit D [Thermodesulfobacteriota bacterium]